MPEIAKDIPASAHYFQPFPIHLFSPLAENV
jgi:hypothetical protein